MYGVLTSRSHNVSSRTSDLGTGLDVLSQEVSSRDEANVVLVDEPS